MPASYPTSAKSFTTKTMAQVIDASHINDLQLEVAALENDLLTVYPGGVAVVSGGGAGGAFNWTPVLTFVTPGNLAVLYATQIGKGVKVGSEVWLSGTIITSAFTHTTASGTLTITGNPFTATSSTGFAPTGAVAWQGITKANYTHVVATIAAGTTGITFLISGSGQGLAQVAAADTPSGGTMELFFTLKFLV